jgi:hypothetical protein
VKNKKENMAITDDEVEYICSKADFPNIKYISVDNPEPSLNAVTHEGILHISRLRWNSLIYLDLGENYFIQPTTASAIKDANTSPKPICLAWSRLISVQQI